jgi:hypothetical protein
MNINEILKQVFGATDDQVAAFAAAMKENSIFTTSHENMDVRYPKMKTDYEGAAQERDAANATIAELKKAAKGQADMQAIITGHEQTIQQLTAQLEQAKLDAAIKVGLLSEDVVDVDYLTFKLHEKLKGDGETLTLDENGAIKGWADKVAGLRTQFPTMFEAKTDPASKDGYEVVDPVKMRRGNGDDVPTKDTFLGMNYEQRLALKQQNEALYRQLRSNDNNVN